MSQAKNKSTFKAVRIFFVLLVFGAPFDLSADEKFAQSGAGQAGTLLKQQSAATCPSYMKVQDCYEEALKRYRGHPQDSVSIDIRDTVAYCNHVAESNDAQFCDSLEEENPEIFKAEHQRQYDDLERERQKRLQEDAQLPKFVTVKAKMAGRIVPGAIVCPDLPRVELMWDWYNQSVIDRAQDIQSHGDSKLMRGPPTATPQFEQYGCALISPGTPMVLDQGHRIPLVKVKVGKRTITGVTFPSMIDYRGMSTEKLLVPSRQ